MDIGTIITTILVMAALGLLLGILISAASKVFFVKKDERIEKITELLPGANCGGCGYAGCADYAKSIVTSDAAMNKCAVGGDDVAAQIASVMGKSAEKTIRMRAQVMCSGTRTLASRKYAYKGLKDCLSVAKLGNGPKECAYGCIGLETCVKKCAFGAIKVENGVAVVEHEKCRACGMCVSACPQHIIKLVPYDADVWVGCSNIEKGRAVTELCRVGCIGCGICAKNCPSGAISIDAGMAVIDYSKCINCGICVQKCPRKIIWSGKDQIANGDTITSVSADNKEKPKISGSKSDRLFVDDPGEFRGKTRVVGKGLEIEHEADNDN